MMGRLRVIAAKLRALFSREQSGSGFDEELETHLSLLTERFVLRGMSPEEAHYAALRQLGNSGLLKEYRREMQTIMWPETLWQDLRFAVRLLRKAPGFTVVAVLSLALGIGVNTAMFSVINAVLLHSFPYPGANRLVRVGRGGGKGDASMPEYAFWKEHARFFSSFAGYRGGGERHFSRGSGDEWISILAITTDFVRTLGIPLSLGREFTAEEAKAGGPSAIVISDGLWRRSFGADPQVLGRSVILEDKSYTVVGVLAPGFWFPDSSDAFVPLQSTGTVIDTGSNTTLIARLKDGCTLKQAQAEMAIITEDFRRANPVSITREYRGMRAISYVDSLVGDVRVNLLVLFGATGLLLLISCSNLAALLFTRFAARRKELAVRMALGSSRQRLLTQFFVENLLIAGWGGAVGLLTAYSLLRGLVAWMPFDLLVSSPIQLDRSVLAFTIAVTAVTALVFTLTPLLATSRINVQESLNSAGRSATGGVRAGARNLLVIGEVALATTLMIGAGLLIQSLKRVYQERLGFAPHGLITFQTPFARSRRENTADRMNFTNTMLERLAAVPGVRGVAATNVLPLVGWSNFPTQREGRPDQSIGAMEIRSVTPAYFELMGIPVRRGRSFAGRDDANSAPVVVINETLARTWWLNGDPTEDRIVIGLYQGHEIGKDPPRQVIGVVGDTKTSLKDLPRPTLFVPMAQTDALGVSSLAWIVNATGVAGFADTLRSTTLEIDPSQRIRQVRSMDEIVASRTASSRFNASLFGIFAGVALLLAAIGVYGLLSFLVAQRRREIGTRIALGATHADILNLIFKQGVVLTTIGLVIGLLVAYFATRWLASLLYGVQSRDFFTFAAAAFVLMLAALIAIYLPAHRAARIDPTVALRYE